MVDSYKPEQYTLSIRLSTDGFSFSICDPVGGEPFPAIEKETDMSLSLTANLKNVFRETDLLDRPYKRVNVLMASRRFTVVPSELFDKEQAEMLFYYNHPKQENEMILYNFLPVNDVVILFGIDKSVCAFLQERYPEVRFFSQAIPLAEYFSSKSRLGNGRKMYASVRKDAIDLFCFERERLLLINSFQCTQTEDRIYYLLYVWKQLGFDQEGDELHLTGILPGQSELLERLRKFIRQVSLMEPVSNIDMQSLLTCE